MAVRSGRRFQISLVDLERLRNCLVEHATDDEERAVERMLGALVTAETAALASGRDIVMFTAPADAADLMHRALRAMARSDRHMERARRYDVHAA
jgi:hypothetical protein